MEDAGELVRTATEELRRARKELECVTNEVRTLSDLVLPALHDHLHNLRSARMSISSEANQCLTVMKDVRQFFLGPDYKVEMERIKEFMVLIDNLKQLAASGTLDVMAETLIKLMQGGERNVRQ